MADVTSIAAKDDQVLTTMGLTTVAKEYAFATGGRPRKVVLYCDAAWKFSDASGGVYLSVPASPNGLEITVPKAGKSIFAKVASSTATLTPIVEG